MTTLMDLANGWLAFFAAHPYEVLVVLLAIEELGLPLPLPGDFLVIYAGALFQRGEVSVVLSILAAFVGVMMGSSLLYVLMSRRGRPIFHKYGHYLHLNPDRMRRVEGWYQSHGAVVIPFGRLIPGLRIPTTVVSGLTGVPYRTFGPLNALSALLWSGFYFYLGAVLAGQFGRLRELFQLHRRLSLALLVSVVLLLLAAGASVLWQRRREQRASLLADRPDQGGNGQ